MLTAAPAARRRRGERPECRPARVAFEEEEHAVVADPPDGAVHQARPRRRHESLPRGRFEDGEPRFPRARCGFRLFAFGERRNEGRPGRPPPESAPRRARGAARPPASRRAAGRDRAPVRADPPPAAGRTPPAAGRTPPAAGPPPTARAGRPRPAGGPRSRQAGRPGSTSPPSPLVRKGPPQPVPALRAAGRGARNRHEAARQPAARGGTGTRDPRSAPVAAAARAARRTA